MIENTRSILAPSNAERCRRALRHATATLLFALLLSPSWSAQESVVVELDVFSASIPEGWYRIPDSEVRKYVEEQPKSSDSKLPTPDLALQLGSDGRWFTLPHALFTVEEGGAYSNPQLALLPKIDLALRTHTDADSAMKAIDKLVEALEYFDKGTGILWVKVSFEHPEYGDLTGLVASIPTKDGVVNITSFTVAPDFAVRQRDFRAIAESVVIAPEHAREEMLDLDEMRRFSANIVGWFLCAGVLVVLFGGAYLAVVMLKKRRSE